MQNTATSAPFPSEQPITATIQAGTTARPDSVAPQATDVADVAARFFRVLGDPTRLRLLHLILNAPGGQRSVGDLVAAVGAPQSRVSTHLGCLRWCGLVQTKRDGKQVYYRVADLRIRDLLTLGETLLRDHAAGVASCDMIR